MKKKGHKAYYELLDKVFADEQYPYPEIQELVHSKKVHEPDFWMAYLKSRGAKDSMFSSHELMAGVAETQQRLFFKKIQPTPRPEETPDLPATSIDIGNDHPSDEIVGSITDTLVITAPRVRVEEFKAPNLYYEHNGVRDDIGGEHITEQSRKYRAIGVAIIEERKKKSGAFVKWHVVSFPLDRANIPAHGKVPLSSIHEITASIRPYNSDIQLPEPGKPFPDGPPKELVYHGYPWQYLLDSKYARFTKNLKDIGAPADPSVYLLHQSFFFLATTDNTNNELFEDILKEFAAKAAEVVSSGAVTALSESDMAGEAAGIIASEIVKSLWPDHKKEPNGLFIDLHSANAQGGSVGIPIVAILKPSQPNAAEGSTDDLWVQGLIQGSITKTQWVVTIYPWFNSENRVGSPTTVRAIFELKGQMRLKVVRQYNWAREG